MKKLLVLIISLISFQLWSAGGALIKQIIKQSKNSLEKALTKTAVKSSKSTFGDALDVLIQVNGGKQFTSEEQVKALFKSVDGDDAYLISAKKKSLEILNSGLHQLDQSEADELLNNALYIAWRTGKGKYAKESLACGYCANEGGVPKLAIIKNKNVKAVARDIDHDPKMRLKDAGKLSKVSEQTLKRNLASQEDLHRFLLFLKLDGEVGGDHARLVSEVKKFYGGKYFKSGHDNKLFLVATNPEVYDSKAKVKAWADLMAEVNLNKNSDRGKAFLETLEKRVASEPTGKTKDDMIAALEEFKRKDCWKLN